MEEKLVQNAKNNIMVANKEKDNTMLVRLWLN